MVNLVDDYVKKRLNSGLPIGRAELLSIQRHEKLKQNDLYYFDVEEANKVIQFTNLLTIIKNGRVEKFKTRGFQNFILGSLMGWKIKATGERLFNEAYVSIGRQNGKSLLLGSLAIYFCGFLKFNNSNIFCTATKLDQAKIVWKNVASFIRANTELKNNYFKIQDHISTITSKKTGSTIKALSKDTSSLDGFDSVLSILDEYHAHPNNQMYKLLFDGQINVENSLLFAITTAGFNLNSACYEHHQFCLNILEGVVDKDRQFIYIATPDEDDKVGDIKSYIKANPFLLLNEDYTINDKKLQDFESKANTAIFKQGEELLNFKTKSLNMWVEFNENSYLNKANIKKCETDMDLKDFKGSECYIGLDLSSGGDLTSLSILIPTEDKVFIYSHSYIPEKRVLECEKNSNAPYRTWIPEYLTVCTVAGGYKTDYKLILNHLKDLISAYDLKVLALGYDPYGAGAYLNDLTEITENLVSITQSARNLGTTVEDFKLSVDSEVVMFNKNNGLYRWSLGNAKVEYNSFREPKVVKDKGNEKIDPIISTINAWWIYKNMPKEEEKNYNDDIDSWITYL